MIQVTDDAVIFYGRINFCKNLVQCQLIGEIPSIPYREKQSGLAMTNPTTLACMDLNIEEYNEELVEGHNLTFDKIYQIKKHIKKLSSIEILNSYKSVAKGREDLILAGGIILLKIMELINLDYIRVSTKGIRYGTIIKEFVLYM